MVVLVAGFGAVAFAGPASAADSTTWICKPGQSDDLCAGTIDGTNQPPPGQSATPLGYTRPEKAPVDCFYLYPTQSDQATPNSNLDKDPPIRRVVVQQARMFSSVCNVYAPMYKQVTNHGNQLSDTPEVEIAYASAKAAFQDYLENYNDGRGFIMIGHSQGSAHTARLIDEMVDTDAELRKRFVGAFAPGANIWVPNGKNVGGMYDNVPACSEIGEFGCLVAFSTYNADPGPAAAFSRLNLGYFIYPEPRPDPAKFEVVCTNPALLDGGNGNTKPLVNFDYLFDTPASETASPWLGQPDYYKVECRRNAGAHWLNLSKLNTPGETRIDLGATVASGSNYHVPEVNLTEGNLLTIAQNEADSYGVEQARIAKLEKKLKKLKSSLRKSKRQLTKKRKSVRKLSKKVRKVKARSKRKRVLKRKLRSSRKSVSAKRKRVKSLKKKVVKVRKQIA
ncbi:MAG: DUF3089 domain-containing protein [Solirubrobacterales bacterium]|nr:DUF3089 domain-containing protein [Solirubrobacterales bacterium]